MKMGAERKKLITLIALVAVAGIVYWFNSSSDSTPTTSSGGTPTAAVAPQSATAPGMQKAKSRRIPLGITQMGDPDFKPPENVDPIKTDATLRLDLLAKVQAVEPEGGVRNIFVRESPPPPDPVKTANTKVPDVGKVDLHGKPPAAPPPPPPPVVADAKPATPVAPPINLKYYGYSTKRSDGEKKAFFLDGEDIIVAAEGEIIKKQYKIVKIGVNSVQMEDTGSKSTQTLPIQQDAAPSPA
jgi:hypothetical protein